MTRIALIGAGNVAHRHARVLGGIPGVRVVSVADLSLEAARRLADLVGARACTEPADALDDTVDAAYVCIPPFAHGAAEEAVLARHLPMFVEKPVGLDLETVDRIEGLVAAAGVVTGTGYHWRCLDTVVHAHEILADFPPLLAQASWLDKRPPVPWWNRRDGSGGQVVEQLAHVLDIARVLIGEVVEVHAAGARALDDGDGNAVDDATAGLLRFAEGTVGTISATCALTAKRGAGLSLVGPGVYLDLSEEALVVDRGDGRARPRRAVADPREAIDRDFVAAVRGERESTVAPYAEAAASHRLGMALAHSARTGRPVGVDAVTTS